MEIFSRFSIPTELSVPFVPLGIDFKTGISLLSEMGIELNETREKEHSIKAKVGSSSIAIYSDGDVLGALWYDDPAGRWSAQGKARKIELHLARYGSLAGWSVWNENSWMRYWKHETEPVRMVYGIHMDVIRFNFHR